MSTRRRLGNVFFSHLYSHFVLFVARGWLFRRPYNLIHFSPSSQFGSYLSHRVYPPSPLSCRWSRSIFAFLIPGFFVSVQQGLRFLSKFPNNNISFLPQRYTYFFCFADKLASLSDFRNQSIFKYTFRIFFCCHVVQICHIASYFLLSFFCLDVIYRIAYKPKKYSQNFWLYQKS